MSDLGTPKKICKECQKLGLKSIIKIPMASCVIYPPVQYWDEDGNFQDVGERTFYAFYCSNGHEWEEEINGSK